MYIEIHLSTEDELTEQGRAVLLALAGVTETPAGVLLAEGAKPETPKKRAPRKPKVVEPSEEALDEAAAEEQDAAKVAKHNAEIEKPVDPEPAPAAEEPEETPTLNEVANVATAFIRNGQRDKIAKILNEDLGVEKVTALKDSPEKVPELFDMLVNFYNELKSVETRKAVRQQLNEDTAPLFLARIEG